MFNIIVAIDSEGGIGQENCNTKNGLPWNIKEDLQYFKNLTENNIIIMGRKTADKFKKPLPNRMNCIISSNKEYRCGEGFISYLSLEECLKDICNSDYYKLEKPLVFIIGGAKLIEESMNFNYLVDKIYLTIIKKNFNCDIKISELVTDFILGKCNLVEKIEKFDKDSNLEYYNEIYSII